ncbi:MAG: ABC transporter substrate-binding protein [Bacteroidia bacterium]|nr:ABC transporter substrate-binding protein [Bacteroidia bacterium]
MVFTDQLGNKIELKQKPRRIVSLVPSQSEFLWDIGLCSELVGISKFCIHPDKMFQSVERVGGTKELNIEKIRALKPDLIIGNKEENQKEQIEILQKEFNVWMSDIYTFDDAFEMMRRIGEITEKDTEVKTLLNQLNNTLPKIKNTFANVSVAYFIWNKPYMFAAGNTFINFLLEYLGFKNVLGGSARYPELSEEQLRNLQPDYCFLSSEPFPFKEKQVEEIQKIVPQSRIILVDGELFSWYGSRLLQLPAYVEELKSKLKSP